MNGSIRQTLAVVAVLCAAAPAAAETVEVTAGVLNVRTGPSTRYAKVGQTSRPKRYQVLGRSGSWVKIQYGARGAWVYAPYTRVVVDPPKLTLPTSPPKSVDMRVVTARYALSVRSGPSVRYRRIALLRRGAKVAVTGSLGVWLRVKAGAVSGWSHGAYLARVSTGPKLPLTPPKSDRPKSRAGFIQLRASGAGFYAYQAGYRRWGKPELIYGVERAGRKWQPSLSGGLRPALGIGDISRENGGLFFPHVSHRYGVDMDARPLRSDGLRAPVTVGQSAYSRTHTQQFLNLLRGELNVDKILFNDSKVSGVRYYRGHANHFHLRIHR